MTESPDPAAVVPEPSRRSLVRGIALLGLAGAAGVPLSACGGGGGDIVSADGPPPAPAQLPTKSQVYRRTPEPRTRTTTTTTRTSPKPAGTQAVTDGTTAPAGTQVVPQPAPVPQPVAPADPVVGSKSSGSQPAARRSKPKAAAETRTPAKPATGGTKPAAPAPAPGPTPAPAAKPSDDLSQARTADIPVGGGRIYPKDKVVVTQPKEGEFKAFSASCTHQGCLVSEVKAGDGILCFCHGSKFGIADGSVLKGPAILPLPAEKITVEGDRIVHGGHAAAPGSRRLRRVR